jgi:hypothetical protein
LDQSGAMDFAAAQRRNRDALNAQQVEVTRMLMGLQVDGGLIDGEGKLAAEDLGSALYPRLIGVLPGQRCCFRWRHCTATMSR